MRTRFAFTLTELLVSIAVLVVIIAAIAKIFSTAGAITGAGQATADVLQEIAAIEQQIRTDVADMTPEGFLAIHCVAVRNGIHGLGGPLLNPNLGEDEWIRADQLVFFASGQFTSQVFDNNQIFDTGGPSTMTGASLNAQSGAARIYYGHAFQLPSGGPAEMDPTTSIVSAQDPDLASFGRVVPWYYPSGAAPATIPMNEVVYDGSYGITGAGLPANVDAAQPAAQKWLLARQAILLADDAGGAGSALGSRSAADIASPPIIWGRVDVAASQLNELRRLVMNDIIGTTVMGPRAMQGIDGQQDIMNDAFFWPRAERVAPSGHRVDQGLTANVLASACSSFQVDWTYAPQDNLMPVEPTNEAPYFGAQPWFGMPDPNNNFPDEINPLTGTRTFEDYLTENALIPPPTGPFTNVDPANIEPDGAVVNFFGPNPDIREYWVTFGYNRTDPFSANADYTPWPSALRITMTLHDSSGRLENGRTVQFVVDLPRTVDN